jgi:hypothetical protein
VKSVPENIKINFLHSIKFSISGRTFENNEKNNFGKYSLESFTWRICWPDLSLISNESNEGEMKSSVKFDLKKRNWETLTNYLKIIYLELICFHPVEMIINLVGKLNHQRNILDIWQYIYKKIIQCQWKSEKNPFNHNQNYNFKFYSNPKDSTGILINVNHNLTNINSPELWCNDGFGWRDTSENERPRICCETGNSSFEVFDFLMAAL